MLALLARASHWQAKRRAINARTARSVAQVLLNAQRA
jgi:hypothetical protein